MLVAMGVKVVIKFYRGYSKKCKEKSPTAHRKCQSLRELAICSLIWTLRDGKTYFYRGQKTRLFWSYFFVNTTAYYCLFVVYFLLQPGRNPFHFPILILPMAYQKIMFSQSLLIEKDFCG
jgi:hypothetical protein